MFSNHMFTLVVLITVITAAYYNRLKLLNQQVESDKLVGADSANTTC